RELAAHRFGNGGSLGDDRVLERVRAGATGPGRETGRDPDHRAPCEIDVLREYAQHVLDLDVGVRRVPAVVVGGERERDEADLGLARELRILELRLADS